MKLGPTAPVANYLLNAALAWLAPVAAWARGTAGSRERVVVIYGWFPGTSKPQVFGIVNVIDVEGLVSAERSLIAMACRPSGCVAAHALAGRDSRSRGTQSSSISGICEPWVRPPKQHCCSEPPLELWIKSAHDHGWSGA